MNFDFYMGLSHLQCTFTYCALCRKIASMLAGRFCISRKGGTGEVGVKGEGEGVLVAARLGCKRSRFVPGWPSLTLTKWTGLLSPCRGVVSGKEGCLGSEHVYDNNLSTNNADYQRQRNWGARGALASPILDLCAWMFHMNSRLLRTLSRQHPPNHVSVPPLLLTIACLLISGHGQSHKSAY